MDAPSVVYRYKDGLYINFTNRCPTACRFCVKLPCKMRYRGLNLDLAGAEPPVEEILRAVDNALTQAPTSEIVFCGYGEPACRMDDLLSICERLRSKAPRLRLNTVGLADLLCGCPAAPLLRGKIDAACVSLNTADPAQWLELMRPLPRFRKKGFSAVQDFIRGCAQEGIDVTATAVAVPEVDLEACRRLSETLGARFAVRPLLEEDEMRGERR
ncbi:MAG: TatD family nuclease-associated radical SAM protein [Elusimicrobiota bacterium]|jgi:TatD DNase family protein